MVPAETKRASRNARFKRTRNALEHALRSCEISNANNFSLTLLHEETKGERESAKTSETTEREDRDVASASTYTFSRRFA
jgi:hypothetical protein